MNELGATLPVIDWENTLVEFCAAERIEEFFNLRNSIREMMRQREELLEEIKNWETKRKAITILLEKADERNEDTEVEFYIGMAYVAVQDED